MARLRYLQNARTGTAGTISKDTKPIQFYDDDMYIYASADGVLEIVSDTTLTLTAPTINLASSTVTAYTYPITIDFNCTASAVSDLTITSVSSSTSGSVVIKPLYVDATMSATGGLGRAIEGKLLVSGKLGDYGNAIKGYTDLTGGTGCAGLVSAICAEMKMPATTALGTHAVLEIELVMPTSAVIQQGIGSNCTSFIRARVSDNSTAVASFNEYGYLLDLQGLTSGSTDLFDACTLKCVIDSTKMYLLLSTATASFTTAKPISVSVAGGTAITLGTSTTGINVAANIVIPQLITVGTLANPLHWSGAASNILIYQENLSTTPGSVTANKFSLSAAQSGATTSGRLECFRAEVKTYSTTAVTADMRALVGQVEFSGDMTYIGSSTADFAGAYGVIASIWSGSDVTANTGNLGKMYPLGIFFGLETNTSLSGEDAYIYIYNYGKVCPNSVMKLYNASTPQEPTYLFDKAHSTLGSASGPFYPQDVNPHETPTSSVLGADGHIKILIGATPYYIPFFANLE